MEGKGFFVSSFSQAYVFPSADVLGTKTDIENWKAHSKTQCTDVLAKTHPALASGLRKQYKIHQKLLNDREQPQAE
jgi:hypothetical protein